MGTVLAAATLLLTLVGCASTPGAQAPVPPATTSPAAAPSPAAQPADQTPEPTPTQSTPPLPSGYVYAEATQNKVRVPVLEDMTSVDAGASADMAVSNPSGTTIHVSTPVQSPALPGESDILPALQNEGAENVSCSSMTTNLGGEAFTCSYSTATNGVTVTGQQLYIQSDPSTVTVITVGSLDPATVTTIIATIAQSIESL